MVRLGSGSKASIRGYLPGVTPAVTDDVHGNEASMKSTHSPAPRRAIPSRPKHF
jgi:hypothetical protein